MKTGATIAAVTILVLMAPIAYARHFCTSSSNSLCQKIDGNQFLNSTGFGVSILASLLLAGYVLLGKVYE